MLLLDYLCPWELAPRPLSAFLDVGKDVVSDLVGHLPGARLEVLAEVADTDAHQHGR